MIKDASTYRSPWMVKPVLAHQYQGWLIDKGSLTARLQRKYAQFSVQALSVHYGKPCFDELRPLGLPMRERALVREVLLLGDYRPVVFAHSVLPRASLRGLWRGLGRLGNQPLGVLLFANPKVKRTQLSYKKLGAHHVLYRSALRHTGSTPPYLWARRSVFNLNGATMMVTEVFFPHIIKS